MSKFSIVIPVYNRPEELQELLTSLTHQTFKDFEVVIVDDGSEIQAGEVVHSFKKVLDIHYFYKPNEGQGFARNYGFERCSGDVMVIFDSDCIVPSDYLEIVYEALDKEDFDVYGGPDAAHESFNLVQKAINHTMTSFFTTGGIRGRKRHVGEYHPRSFNMGMRKEVYENLGGYIIPFMGEDLEFTIRIIRHGYKTKLIPSAFVYHKRRTSLLKFFKQLMYFGRARINLSRFHRGQVKLIHLFPTVFTLGLLAAILLSGLRYQFGYLILGCYGVYLLMIFVEALFTIKSILASFLTPFAAILQLCGYGYGLVYEWIRKLLGINPNTRYTELY